MISIGRREGFDMKDERLSNTLMEAGAAARL